MKKYPDCPRRFRYKRRGDLPYVEPAWWKVWLMIIGIVALMLAGEWLGELLSLWIFGG